MAVAQLLKRQNIFYGWVIVFVCFIIIGLAFGIRLTFGLFFDTLTRGGDFSWGRANTAGVFSTTMIVFALGSAPCGWMLDRWGTRRLFAAGVLVMASGLASTSRMTSLFQFYLFYGVVTGLGITMLGLSMQAATISRWFDRTGRRGLAIGIAFSGTGFGILILAPILEQIISQLDWRTAYIFLAALLITVALPLVFFLLRNRPGDINLIADGRDTRRATPAPQTSVRPSTDHPPTVQITDSWTIHRALRTARFWLLMISGAASLFTLRMITVHQVAHFVDLGIPRLTAATILGSTGMVTAGAFIVFGLLSDRIGRGASFAIGAIAQLTALYLLITLGRDATSTQMYTYALLWGIGEGSRSGLLTATAGDIFPGNALGTIVGTLGGFFGAGAATGSWLAGWLFDSLGNYTLAFQIAFFATIMATVCMAVIQWGPRNGQQL